MPLTFVPYDISVHVQDRPIVWIQQAKAIILDPKSNPATCCLTYLPDPASGLFPNDHNATMSFIYHQTIPTYDVVPNVIIHYPSQR